MNTNNETHTPEKPDTASPIPEVKPVTISSPVGAMTHMKPEVETDNNQTDMDPAGINTIETTTVGPEIEPTTIAFTPGNDPQAAPDQTPAGQVGQAANSESQSNPAVAATPSVTKKDKKLLIIATIASVVLFAVIGVVAWWMLTSNKEPSDQSDSTLSTIIEQPKLGVVFTVVDGTVELSTDGAEWQAATMDSQLQESSLVRTGTDSRTVLMLDDGSAIRLDANTQVKLVSLSADDVKVEQIDGSVYSRIVPSERSYIVTVDTTSYEALGTAFVTIKKENESGVQVYQSSVKTSESDEAVTEGKQYYKTSADAALQGKLTDINIDALVDSAFVTWNLSQDESDTNFKDKLGVLSRIKERKTAIEAERVVAEQTAKEEAARVLREKQEAAAKEAERASQINNVTRGTMTLGLVGKKFTWNYTGKAVHGYKFVYSKKTATPTFGSSDSVYFGDIDETSGELPSKEKMSAGKYYVRVCAYTATIGDDACVDYSNVVVINI